MLCQDVFATNEIPLLEGTASSSIVQNAWYNWECLETIDTEAFIAAIVQAKAEAAVAGDKVLFVEGFLLFADVRVTRLCDVKLFIDIDKETCYQRYLPFHLALVPSLWSK